MQDAEIPTNDPDAAPRISWRVKLVVGLLVLLAVGVVLVTNRWLSERFTETTRNRAELRLALYSGNMVSELQRTSVVPLLLAGDPALVEALHRTNAALWEVEDALRDHERRQDFGASFVELARSVYRLNDERASLKKRINLAAGSLLVEEKSYAAY